MRLLLLQVDVVELIRAHCLLIWLSLPELVSPKLVSSSLHTLCLAMRNIVHAQRPKQGLISAREAPPSTGCCFAMYWREELLE